MHFICYPFTQLTAAFSTAPIPSTTPPHHPFTSHLSFAGDPLSHECDNEEHDFACTVALARILLPFKIIKQSFTLTLGTAQLSHPRSSFHGNTIAELALHRHFQLILGPSF